MKVYIVYSSNGYTCSPPLKVFNTKEAAEEYRKRNGYSRADEFEVCTGEGEENV